MILTIAWGAPFIASSRSIAAINIRTPLRTPNPPDRFHVRHYRHRPPQNFHRPDSPARWKRKFQDQRKGIYRLLQAFDAEYHSAAAEIANAVHRFDVEAKTSAEELPGQAGALRLAISRALLRNDEGLRGSLREEGLLTRDPRMKERKKPASPERASGFNFPNGSHARLHGAAALDSRWLFIGDSITDAGRGQCPKRSARATSETSATGCGRPSRACSQVLNKGISGNNILDLRWSGSPMSSLMSPISFP
jgi:hypothetical protein